MLATPPIVSTAEVFDRTMRGHNDRFALELGQPDYGLFLGALADQSSGFVWRLQSETGNATDIQTTSDPRFIVNMSLWLSAEALFDFVYRSAHTPEMARRREYFERFEGAYQALWWVPAGHVPSVDEGLSRLWRLDRYGPMREAFTFKMQFPAPGIVAPPKDMGPDPWCMGRA